MKRDIKTEILSGIVIAIALVPEAIGFAFVLGVDPMIAIYTTIIMGIVSSVFGGRPAMITAATGAIASIFVGLVADFGPEYLYLAVIMTGVFQLILSYLNIGKIIRLISTPIMLGFVNGLAYIMLSAQIDQFKIPGSENWLQGIDLLIMLLITIITILIVILAPKVTTKIPATFFAIIVGTILSIVLANLGFTVYTVYDYAGKHLNGSIPVPHIPDVPYNLETFKIILVPAFSAAIVGFVESFLTLNLIDEMTDTRGDVKKEGTGQGIANIVAGLFGGMGGCAMLGQSLINIGNGARTYISTFMASFVLLLLVLFGTPVLEIIPLGVLVGIMLVVIYKTIAWESFVLHKKADRFDVVIVVVVTVLTMITHNLAIAVISGVLLAAAKFTWDKSQKIQFKKDNGIIYIEGLLYFAAMDKTKENLILVEDTTIDFSNAKILDYTSAETIVNIVKKARDNGHDIKVINLDEDSEHKITRVLNQN